MKLNDDFINILFFVYNNKYDIHVIMEEDFMLLKNDKTNLFIFRQSNKFYNVTEYYSICPGGRGLYLSVKEIKERIMEQFDLENRAIFKW